MVHGNIVTFIDHATTMMQLKGYTLQQ